MDVLTADKGTSLLKVSLFMEYCPQGSLQDLIDRKQQAQDHVTEAVTWKIFGQLSLALRYCHYGICANGTQIGGWEPVLHRDIKPANILVTKIEAEEVMVKLGDFGLATFVNPERAPSTYARTLRYQPPTDSSSAGDY
ncbi:hypothetical protein EPUS_08794 [Endocarpon pusillum Z07020]|uniref:non-specific serine/threonine protein kinase n=1 Tax=Endocarpon pusillum (strain Z07020 / HMAS-L-300199) TaxID=1263415 RepID=U1GLY3_ENDPU|nr:uncharacterized protein EPUS_08794 [Endocarpon pusillum Z07020]ERF73243.1 hypothetical protein EPUS_08794 [Endocarpon pusillum Z07020]